MVKGSKNLEHQNVHINAVIKDAELWELQAVIKHNAYVASVLQATLSADIAAEVLTGASARIQGKLSPVFSEFNFLYSPYMKKGMYRYLKMAKSLRGYNIFQSHLYEVPGQRIFQLRWRAAANILSGLKGGFTEGRWSCLRCVLPGYSRPALLLCLSCWTSCLNIKEKELNLSIPKNIVKVYVSAVCYVLPEDGQNRHETTSSATWFLLWSCNWGHTADLNDANEKIFSVQAENCGRETQNGDAPKDVATVSQQPPGN